MVCRPATLWDGQKCRVMGHTVTYWNGLSGNGAQRSYQVFQVTLLALQCESQMRERSKPPRVLTLVCSQIRWVFQCLTILPAQGPAGFLLLTTAHHPFKAADTQQTLSPSPDVCLLLKALLSSPVSPHQPSEHSTYFSSASGHFFRLTLILQMHQN